jgi:hypothetical protein
MNDLFLKSFKATTKYVRSRIQSERHREAYYNESQFIINKLPCLTLNYLNYYKNLCVPKVWYKRDVLDFFYNTTDYRKKAYDDAIDILNSLEKRFVTGGSGDKFYVNTTEGENLGAIHIN